VSAAAPDNYPLTPGRLQSYALQYSASLATITTGSSISGSANKGAALNSLNENFPAFTGTNATDANGKPAYSFSYNENRTAGTALATVTAAAGGTAITYAITSGNTTWFSIAPTTGVITLTAAGAASLANNFESAPNAHTLTVSATNSASSVTAQIVLNELDLAELDLEVTKTASYDPIPVNGLFDYTVTAKNLPTGAGAATGVTVTDTLPAGITVRAITTSQGSCTQNGAVVTCALGSLQNGASATIAIAATAPSAATLITNSASITATETDTNSTNNSATVQSSVIIPVPLSVTKVSAIYSGSGAGTFAVPGQQMVYTIQVSNPSIQVSRDTVLIVDNLPTTLEFYNGDFDPAAAGSGPIKFTDGSTPSGLSCCNGADIAYSDDAAGTANPAFDYSPQAGFDPNVRFIRINPKGIMAAENGATPSFTINFRGRIK
jgi:uncharacterized repeat protein (TIGR01451 family)